MRQLLLASTNKNKIREITDIMQAYGISDLTIDSILSYNIPEPEEPYNDFMQNAMHKAKYYGDLLGMVTLSDDSGLCVEELGGFPGVRTKDFVYDSGSFENAFNELERKLTGASNYNASFHTAIAIYLPKEDRFISYEGKCEGKLRFPASGSETEALDPIFVPRGFDQSMADLGLGIKNQISHRSIALKGITGLLMKEFT